MPEVPISEEPTGVPPIDPSMDPSLDPSLDTSLDDGRITFGQPRVVGRDPVCGTDVSTMAAPHVEYKGVTYRFCGEICRTTFQADPARYAGR
jgi:YHS domain-containing protein